MPSDSAPLPQPNFPMDLSATIDSLQKEIASLRRRDGVQSSMTTTEQLAALFPALELAPIGMSLMLLDTYMVMSNRAFCRMIGYTAEELSSLSIKEITHPDDLENSIATHQRMNRGEIEGYHLEKRYRRKDGSFFWASVDATSIRNASGEVIARMAAIQDISVRKSLEEGLRQMRSGLERQVSERTRELEDRTIQHQRAERHLRAILDNAADGIITIDDIGNITDFNKAAEHIFGYAASEVIGRNVSLLMPEPYRSKHSDYIENYLRSGQGKIIGIGREVVGQRKDGSLFPLELAVGEVRADGLRLFTGIARDITERKRTEQALLESESRFRKLAATAPLPIFVIDSETGVILFSNPAANMTLGYTPEHPLAGQHATIFYADPTQRALIVKQTIENQGVESLEILFRRANGEAFWGLTSSRLTTYEGRPAFLVSITDISQLKQVQEEIRIAQERASSANQAKSEFLSRMSHELRTPLNAILGFSQFLLDRPGEGLPASDKDFITQINKAGQHLLTLINEVLDLSRIEAGSVEVDLETLSPADQIHEVLELARPLAEKRDISLEFSTDFANAPLIQADRRILRQVLLNLISNAVKYGKASGRVWVEIRSVTDFSGIPRLRLAVHDDGHGIPAERQKDIFRPFNRLGAENTTVEGTGIGLTITKKLVEAMDGTIGFSSIEGQGSIFWTDMPLAAFPVEDNQEQTSLSLCRTMP